MTTSTDILLTPMWQRIENGQVDLSRYTDEEVLSGEIRMADGRMLPRPAVFPEVWVREQVRRGLRVAERKIRDNALKALDVYADILGDVEVEPRDRMKAAEFFTTRFLGKPEQHVHVHDGDAASAREILIERLVAARRGLPAAQVQAIVEGDPDGIVDAEVLEDASPTIEDLL